MKYLVLTDNEGYILTITHTGTKKDFAELDLSNYDLTKLHAYKLGKDELIFDEERWNQIVAEEQKKANEKEIAELEQRLKDTDYIISRWGEDIMALDNRLTWIADAIIISVKYSKQYKEALANRKSWRARIEELKGE